MCYQRLKERWCRAKALLAWLIPTRKQRWALGLLILVTLTVASRTERRRRDELLRATAAQALTVENRLKDELEAAAGVHERLQEQIDSIERRLAELDRKQGHHSRNNDDQHQR